MRATLVAIAVHVAILALVLASPLWVRATGTLVYLETEKMDPRSLFRGHYVILGYTVAQGILEPRPKGGPGLGDNVVYVTVTTERPARFVSVGEERPQLGPGEACIVGRARGSGGSVDFPQIAQFFAPRERAQRLEGLRGKELLAKARVSPGCNAILLGLEAR
jgi:hypothetical protein